MKYKYWLFYLKTNDDLEYELYAYTNNKEFALEFEKSRDMSKFVKKKKKISKDEVNFLARNYQSNILQRIILKTSNMKNEIIETEIIGTMIEQITVTNEATKFMICGIYENCYINPYYLNQELYEALEILEYVSIFDCMNLTGYNKPSKGFNPKIVADELSIFIHNFGKSMK